MDMATFNLFAMPLCSLLALLFAQVVVRVFHGEWLCGLKMMGAIMATVLGLHMMLLVLAMASV